MAKTIPSDNNDIVMMKKMQAMHCINCEISYAHECFAHPHSRRRYTLVSSSSSGSEDETTDDNNNNNKSKQASKPARTTRTKTRTSEQYTAIVESSPSTPLHGRSTRWDENTGTVRRKRRRRKRRKRNKGSIARALYTATCCSLERSS